VNPIYIQYLLDSRGFSNFFAQQKVMEKFYGPPFEKSTFRSSDFRSPNPGDLGRTSRSHPEAFFSKWRNHQKFQVPKMEVYTEPYK